MILSVTDSLKNVGGLGNVLMQLHRNLPNHLNEEFKISTFNNYNELHGHYEIREEDFFSFNFKNLKYLKNCRLIISHQRKTTTYLILLKFFLFFKFKIVHVAHSVYNNKKHASLFPKEIVAVSQGVKNNHISYFKIPDKNITVIHNGIIDKVEKTSDNLSSDVINVLMPGRICDDKMQLQIIEELEGKISNRIKILFAGTGPNSQMLVNRIKSCNSFEYLGLVNETDKLFSYADYVMLYSKREGLPISLIEATMFGKPIICNNVGGNLEIVKHGENGYNVNSFDELINCLNNLEYTVSNNYKKMSKESRKIYLSKFQEAKMISKYVDFFSL